MKIGSLITSFSTNRPKAVTVIMLVLTVSLGLLAVLPSIWPSTFKSLNPLKVDTDPENMLPHDEAVRIFHRDMKKEKMISEDDFFDGRDKVQEITDDFIERIDKVGKAKEDEILEV